MFYRCKDCGGNAVYDPKKKKMVCESCGNEETQEKIPQEKLHICNNCGAEIESKKTDLALKCPYCGTYVIFEDRMKDAYKPDLALPFVIDRKEAIEIIRKNFAKKMFIPKDFCSTSSLESLQGRYVPFWMYDMETHVHFEGEGRKIRTWTEGDYDCTETSIYRLVRDFDVNYDKIPVDASKNMPDEKMDLVEPYKYTALGKFRSRYLSGFQAEIYDENKEELLPRAQKKAKKYILFIFTLIMTTFAWFAYSKVLNSQLNMHVAAWDMEYFIGEEKKENPIGIEFPTLYPHMPEQTVTVDILNNGEALVDLNYNIQAISIAGVSYELVPEGKQPTTENYINIEKSVVEEKETGEVVAKGKIINDTTKFPFTLEIEHSAQVSAKNKAYLKVTANWAGDNDELDSKWGYTVGKYFMDNPKVTSAMSVTLSIDSYQANEEIKGGTE